MTLLSITMPQPGETITEGLIVAWKKSAGDFVKEGEILAELETEKALFDYASPFEGKLTEILFPDNSRVKVGLPIATIEVAAEKEKHYALLGLAQPASPNKNKSPENHRQQACPSREPEKMAGPVAQAVKNFSAKTSPYVRKLAREKGLTLAAIDRLAAESPDGRVTLAMLNNTIPIQDTKTPAKPATATNYSAQPCSPIRMRIAENMVLAKTRIPHAHTGLAVDVSRVIKYRDSIKDDFKQRAGQNLSFLSLIYPALVEAIKKFPVVNASYHDATMPHEIRLFNKINLGIAVGSEHGLFIPVMHDIENFKRDAFNQKLNDLIKRSHENKLSVDELTGATLIFNNFGFFGTSIGVQVISYPLAATLGMGVIEKRVVPTSDGITVHEMADFVLAFDHRVMDGRDAGLFLSSLKEGIENLF